MRTVNSCVDQTKFTDVLLKDKKKEKKRKERKLASLNAKLSSMLTNSASFKSSYFLFCVLCIICFILFVYKYILVSFLQRVPISTISRNLKSKNLLLVFFGLSCTHIYPVYPFHLLSVLQKTPPFVSCGKLCCNSLQKVLPAVCVFLFFFFSFSSKGTALFWQLWRNNLSKVSFSFWYSQ